MFLRFDVDQRLIACALCVVVVGVNEGGGREKEGGVYLIFQSWDNSQFLAQALAVRPRVAFGVSEEI